MANPETVLKRHILLALNRLPYARFFNNPIGFDELRGIHYGLAKGSSDLIGIVRGRFVGLEVKTIKGREEDDQRLWRECITRLGGFAYVVRSVDEAVRIVQQIPEARP